MSTIEHSPTIEADFKIISESELFDRSFYVRSNADVAEAAIDPLMHFCQYGWHEHRDPAPFFSMRYYAAAVSRKERIIGNPFVHYITKGQKSQLRTRPEHMGPIEVIPTIKISQWPGLLSRKLAAEIDVIVPVYRGLRDTAACLYSVLSCEVKVPFRLVVVNDKSPEGKLNKLLKALSERGLFHYIENSSNHGFTYSVNRGMQLGIGCHKILLNSDTIVYDGWIDRIVAHAANNERLGTITPLSNNATIFSYPDTNSSNNYSVEVSLASIDLLTSVVNRGRIFDVPTGVGFCMYIDAKCHEEVGDFDEATFNRGYGEENDFCVRASSAGWRNVAAADVFVRHTGEVSFALDAGTQQKSGYIALLKKHPRYESAVKQFVTRDPLRIARRVIDLERLLFGLKQRRIAIFVTHNQGGGIDTHIAEIAKGLELEGIGIIVLSPNRVNASEISLNLFGATLYLPNLRNIDEAEFISWILPRLVESGLEVVHLHSAVGFNISDAESLIKKIADSGVRVVATMHDYSAICPRHQLVDDGEDYCDIPSPSVCNVCISNLSYAGRNGRKPDILKYRHQYAKMLSHAKKIFVPSSDTRDRIRPYLGKLDVQVRKHTENNRSVSVGRTSDFPSHEADKNRPLKVVTLGAIGPHKGSLVIFGCAADAARRSLNIEYHVVGYTNIDERLSDVGVKITGPYYSTSELAELVKEIKPDIAFFPSIWPETYMYALSDAMELRIFPVTFDIGAQAERIGAVGWGALIDVQDRYNSEFINDSLISMGMRLRSEGFPEAQSDFKTRGSFVDYYQYSNESL
ncbi:glycosyltransferase [Tardiphaga sp. vice154]|uniref:glycosyltransferase n=1 Tax=Tardiphaga sp. vice154 TaxID=2592814 RepID=UPI001163977E|nr:glycosyltransferase [Tardiphaga sp. vice154]QDM22629.1 glycosyltransferase [Tardiphaga sp. vice154]